MTAALRSLRLGLESDSIGNPVQPTGQRVPVLHRLDFLREQQKRGLESVLAVLGMLQDAPAHPIDHRPMPPHQRIKNDLIAGAEESFDQFPVGSVHQSLGRHPACQAAQIRAQCCRCHVCPALWASFRDSSSRRGGEVVKNLDLLTSRKRERGMFLSVAYASGSSNGSVNARRVRAAGPRRFRAPPAPRRAPPRGPRASRTRSARCNPRSNGPPG